MSENAGINPNDLDAFKEMTKKKEVCPTCGRCPTCRRKHETTPAYPYWPAPWPNYPHPYIGDTSWPNPYVTII